MLKELLQVGKRPGAYKNLVHLQTAISKPHGNTKPKKYSKYTQKEKQSKLNTMYGHQIKTEQNKTKDLQKQMQNN